MTCLLSSKNTTYAQWCGYAPALGLAFERMLCCRSARSAVLVVAVACSPGLARETRKENKDTPSQGVYLFDQHANELAAVMFPRQIYAENILKPFLWRSAPLHPRSLGDVQQLNLEAERVSRMPPHIVNLKRELVESDWLSIGRDGKIAAALLGYARQRNTNRIIARLLENRPFRFATVAEKALFQRDVYQFFSGVFVATKTVDDPVLRTYGDGLLMKLAQLWKPLVLTYEEWNSLKSSHAQRGIAESYVINNPWSLEHDYMPERVVRDAAAWYEFRLAEDASKHFRSYRGRSFMRFYIKLPGVSEEKWYEYWEHVFAKYGSELNVSPDIEPLPARTETLFVRTFGVTLTDGSYVDSGVVEEVAMRLFKWARPKLDLSSSDYRGTLQYQYKLRRSALISDSGHLRLDRVLDDDVQFTGFFGDAPDPLGTMGRPLETMRFNCISCHSPVHYGASTVFSHGFQPLPTGTVGRLESGMLERLPGQGRYRLTTPEMNALHKLVAALPADVKVGEPKQAQPSDAMKKGSKNE